jgi:hypothetical protein
MLNGDVLRGAQRNYYSVRLIALCVVSSVVMAAVVSIIAALLITSNSTGRAYDTSLEACARGNKIRRESNARIRDHITDRDNLKKLAERLADNRKREASTFAAIGGAFGIEKKVDPLVRLLNRASTSDQEIADLQTTVKFARLPIINCKRTIKRP